MVQRAQTHGLEATTLCIRGCNPVSKAAALRIRSQAFDEAGFFEGAPEAVRPFLHALRASQLFEVFIQTHVELPAEARPPCVSPPTRSRSRSRSPQPPIPSPQPETRAPQLRRAQTPTCHRLGRHVLACSPCSPAPRRASAMPSNVPSCVPPTARHTARSTSGAPPSPRVGSTRARHRSSQPSARSCESATPLRPPTRASVRALRSRARVSASATRSPHRSSSRPRDLSACWEAVRPTRCAPCRRAASQRSWALPRHPHSGPAGPFRTAAPPPPPPPPSWR